MLYDPFLRFAISRRAMLGSVIAGLGACLTGLVGCREPLAMPGDTKTPSDPTLQRLPAGPPFTDQGYRLYGIVPKEGAPFNFNDEQVQVLRVWVGHYPQLVEIPFDFAVWATPDSAKRLATLSDIESVTEKQPGHVVEIGSPEHSRPAETEPGLLAVSLLPTHDSSPQPQQVSASIAQIVKAWRDATRDIEGVVINPGPKVKPESLKAEEVPRDDQIIVRFSSPTLDPRVLRLIKSHPQVIAIRWGAMFTYFYCPPCGMG